MKKKDTQSKEIVAEPPKKEELPKEDLIKVITALKEELDNIKTGHNQLVDYITAQKSQEKRVEENNQNTIPTQDERSEGIMDNKIGSASIGDIVTIARAYLEQSRQEQAQAQSPDSFFADVGKNAFTQWIESAFGKNFKTQQQSNTNGVQ